MQYLPTAPGWQSDRVFYVDTRHRQGAHNCTILAGPSQVAAVATFGILGSQQLDGPSGR